MKIFANLRKKHGQENERLSGEGEDEASVGKASSSYHRLLASINNLGGKHYSVFVAK